MGRVEFGTSSSGNGEARLPRPPGRNLFLGALSQQAFSQLQPHLEPVELSAREVLRKVGDPARFVYFLDEGLVSFIIETSSGKAAEIAIVGRDGLAGAPTGLRLPRTPITEIVQVRGTAYRMSAAILARILQENVEVRELVSDQVTLMAMRIAQVAGCNALHNAEQRLARWLLMVSDQLQATALPITQEFLGILLGITRQSVSETANALQKTGAIKIRRQTIEILNRKILERRSCECYGVIAGLRLRRMEIPDWDPGSLSPSE